MSTGKKRTPTLWNGKAGYMEGTEAEVKMCNAYLDKMKVNVSAAHILLYL